MRLKLSHSLFLTSVFLLTSVSYGAEDPYFKQAQKFFLQRNKAQQSQAHSKSIASKNKLRYRKPQSRSPKFQRNFETSNKAQANSSAQTSAVYLSLINEKFNQVAESGPDIRTSIGLSIPILNATPGKTHGEFSISGDIRNASEWGRINLLHRESIDIIRWNNTQLQAFIGAGLGYSYGDLVEDSHRIFAPWKAGLFFNQIHKEQPIFYRFELGFTGDIVFSDQSYKSGFLANLSLGYKL